MRCCNFFSILYLALLEEGGGQGKHLKRKDLSQSAADLHSFSSSPIYYNKEGWRMHEPLVANG